MADKIINTDVFDDEIAKLYSEVTAAGYHPQEKYLNDLLKIIPKNSFVLELGCGTGDIIIPLNKSGIECWGLDKSSAMLYQLLKNNKHIETFLDDVRDFDPCGIYNYVFSCNGPFSIKKGDNGDELESYILDEDEVRKVLEKCTDYSQNGILINKSTEKDGLKLKLNGKKYVHEEQRDGDIIKITHLLYDHDELIGKKEHTKKRYPLKRILADAKEVREHEHFKQIFIGK